MERCADIDAGYIVYRAGFVGENRSIRATHLPTGEIFLANNITEFWGTRGDGGILADCNMEREKDKLSPFSPEDFEIEDIQTTKEPVANVLHTVKMMIESCLGAIPGGVTDRQIFIDVGESWRVGRSTLLEYKGNRKDSLRPLFKDAIIDYLVSRYDATGDEGLESDDLVTMAAWMKEDHVVCSVDKDALGQPTLVFNPDKPDVGILDCDCFGKLWVNPKNEVKGYGRIWLYYQTLSGDSTDNYKANCFSGKRWGSKSAYKALKGTSSDKEALKVVKESFEYLYPEECVVQGWKGKVSLSAGYAANEIFDLARMLRFKDDRVTLTDVFKKMKL